MKRIALEFAIAISITILGCSTFKGKERGISDANAGACYLGVRWIML